MGMEEEAQAPMSVSVRYIYYSQKFLSLSFSARLLSYSRDRRVTK